MQNVRRYKAAIAASGEAVVGPLSGGHVLLQLAISLSLNKTR